jgi:hypothetical protein
VAGSSSGAAPSCCIVPKAAFAAAITGEAELLAGQLDDAQRDLEEALELHRAIGAKTGEAHSLQRLAQVRLARGERSAAGALPGRRSSSRACPRWLCT